MNILVTGGAGYIGSHAVQRLLRDPSGSHGAEGNRVIVLDNLFRGHVAALEKLGLGVNPNLTFLEGSITDATAVQHACSLAPIDTVMHFAALAYVGESVDEPLRYLEANVTGLATVLDACARFRIPRFVFSSSCSTFGNPSQDMIPVPENCPQSPVSPYGRSKLMGEWLIRDFAQSMKRKNQPFGYAFLRYFNVAGCDSSGLLGEDHTPESHLIPILMQVALGQRTHIDVFGSDYPTPDGTCVRDYVYIEDLIDAHVLAMNKLQPGDERSYNVGIGKGYSVREIIEAARKVTGHPIPVREGPRRDGDAAMLFNKPDKIRAELGWSPRYTNIQDVIATAWNWFKQHPNGYKPTA